MKNAWNALCLGVLVLSVTLLSSCETSSAGAASSIGTEKYVMGTYSLVFSAPIFSTDKAIRAATTRANFCRRGSGQQTGEHTVHVPRLLRQQNHH